MSAEIHNDMESDEQENELKLAALRKLMDEGDACDPAEDITGETMIRQMKIAGGDLDDCIAELKLLANFVRV